MVGGGRAEQRPSPTIDLRSLSRFRSVWVVDFEFDAPPGSNPTVVCMVAFDAVTGTTIRLWQDELYKLSAPPYPVDDSSVVVGYYISAEVGCHLALGWPVPANLFDAFTEFRNHTNGLKLTSGSGLLGALVHFGIDAMDAATKEAMRALAAKGSWTTEEKTALLAYCEADVTSTVRLLERLLPHVECERALLRGKYMGVAAQIERIGIPIDVEALETLRRFWPEITRELIHRIDAPYGVFAGTTFKRERFERLLIEHGIPWPRTKTGVVALDDDTFKDMARAFPFLGPLRELRASLSQLRLFDLAVGPDHRNRTLLSAFSSRTSRNQPSNTRFAFGTAVWLRGLIRPPEGHAVVYLDYEQQEFAVAAALSGDENMMNAYRSGDAYLAFGKQAGVIPADATKKSHKAARDQCKATALAAQYGAGPGLIADRTNLMVPYARELLKHHQRTYPTYWRWSDSAVAFAMAFSFMPTVFGWNIHVGPEANSRSLMNFPIQANSAEMLRLACIFSVESGVQVAAPVHDAVLVVTPIDKLQETIAITEKAMADASEIVLDGFRIRTEAKIVTFPDRYMDERGETMWTTVWQIIKERQS
jgi:DNA polymerase-1